MNRSKNEIKERRGMIGCVIAIAIPLFLFGGYYYFLISRLNNLGKSIRKVRTESSERNKIKRAKNDTELIFKEILVKGNRGVFTAIKKENEITYANALQIEAVDSLSIKYKIESLENWKSKPDIEGIVNLDYESIGNKKWLIKDRDGNLKPAFRFIGTNKNCQIEILISKEKISESIAIAKKICETKTVELTPTMNFK